MHTRWLCTFYKPVTRLSDIRHVVVGLTTVIFCCPTLSQHTHPILPGGSCCYSQQSNIYTGLEFPPPSPSQKRSVFQISSNLGNRKGREKTQRTKESNRPFHMRQFLDECVYVCVYVFIVFSFCLLFRFNFFQISWLGVPALDANVCYEWSVMVGLCSRQSFVWPSGVF